MGWHCAPPVADALPDQGLDAVLEVVAPDGQRATYGVEVKRLIPTRDVADLVDQLRARLSQAGFNEATPLLVARYLSPATRDRIQREGAGYADATGNAMLTAAQPGLLVRTSGLDHDPWRGPGRPRDRLTGTAAARVIHELVDRPPPYTVPELAARSGASTGATYRVVKLLEAEGLILREPRGDITDVSWRALIERWSRDAGFSRSPSIRSYLFPRGLDQLLDAMQWLTEFYVLTGSLAAQAYAPYAEPKLAMIYAKDPGKVAEFLELRPVDKGANVLLAPDDGTACFVNAGKPGGSRVEHAAPSQIALDLLNGPGRSPSEAHALMDWMETHENRWRL